MEQKRTPAIHTWLGRFIDRDVERQFLDTTLSQQRSRGMAVAVAVTTISCLHLIYEVPRFLHNLGELELVFWLRLVDFLASVPFLIFQYRTTSQSKIELAQTLYGLVLVAVSFAMMAYNPSDGALAAAGIVAMTSGIYFFAPLTVWRVVFLGAAMSISGWLACAVVRGQSAEDAFRLAVWLVVINGIGWFGTLTLNRTMRQWFWEKRLLTEAYQRERIAFDRFKEFAQLISHEFRNPLAVVKSKAQLMQLIADTGAPPEPSALGAIECAVDRLNTLLTQWLQSDSYAESSFAPVSRKLLLTDLFARVQAVKPESARHPIVFVSPPADLAVVADADLLAIVLSNLLDNAVKYSPQGGDIRVGARLQDGQAVIDVRDHGQGIDPELAHRVFEKYFRVSHDTGVQGFGLGLFLVQKIVHLHGGAVTLAAAAEGGTIFSISLPVAE